MCPADPAARGSTGLTTHTGTGTWDGASFGREPPADRPCLRALGQVRSSHGSAMTRLPLAPALFEVLQLRNKMPLFQIFPDQTLCPSRNETPFCAQPGSGSVHVLHGNLLPCSVLSPSVPCSLVFLQDPLQLTPAPLSDGFLGVALVTTGFLFTLRIHPSPAPFGSARSCLPMLTQGPVGYL
jgi:hypothetical protein